MFQTIAFAQGIIFVQLSTPDNIPHVFPEDDLGLRLFSQFPESYDVVINGQTRFTFTSGSEFGISQTSLSGVIAVPIDQFGANFGVPLAFGQQIGPDAAGYQWFVGGIGTSLAAHRDVGIGQNGDFGLFANLESGYLGLEYQQNGHTFYGWANVGAPAPIFNGGWIYNYAFETSPDTPILAGQIPEPSSGALALALVSMLCLSRKRRCYDFCSNTKPV
jgi:hypothetical protein